jgi:hypothetical protein
VNPLDRFRILEEGEKIAGGTNGGIMMHETLVFDDLAVAGKLAEAQTTRYRYRIEPPLDGAGENDEWQETTKSGVPLGLYAPAAESKADSTAGSAAAREPRVHQVTIETSRDKEGFGPAVRIQLERDGGPTLIVAIRR